MEQVRAETEQWSQMQEMLGHVREEMEELQASRDFWEDRALDSDYEIRSVLSSVSLSFLDYCCLVSLFGHLSMLVSKVV